MVKLVTFDSAYECYMAWPIILISPYLFPLSLWIQITIHPLSTDGVIVILVFIIGKVTGQLGFPWVTLEGAMGPDFEKKY